MENNAYEIGYSRQKTKKLSYFYSDLLSELLLLRYEFGFKDVSKKDVLSELPSLREFTNKEVEKIYNNAIELLKIKSNIITINDNPFSFKKVSD